MNNDKTELRLWPMSYCFSILNQLCHLEPHFLAKPVPDCPSDDSYQCFKYLVNGFSPVNDAGEHTVKFASDFNGAITRKFR